MTPASPSRNSTDWRYGLRPGKPTPQSARSVSAASYASDTPWWSRPWIAASGVCIGLALWNWALMIGLAIALAVGVVVYLHLTHQLRIPHFIKRATWQRNRYLWLSLLAGGGTLALIALGITIWQDSGSPGIAAALLLQGAGIWVAVGAIARWMQRSSSKTASDTLTGQQVCQLLTELTHAQPLKRLMAVRLLTTHVLSRQDDSGRSHHKERPSKTVSDLTPVELHQYFRLMLEQEFHAQVQTALRESLTLLESQALVSRNGKSQPCLTASQRPQVAVQPALKNGSKSFLVRHRVRSRSSKVACPEVVSSHS